MPAPMLHLTFGALCAEDKDCHPTLARAMQAEPVYTRLGSIIHDLPYYPNIAKMTIRFAMGLPGLPSPWGYRIHFEKPGLLFRNFIERVRIQTGLTLDERLALMAGFVSHVSLDIAQHPLVVALARRDVIELGGHEDYHHWICEKYQSAFFHKEVVGEDMLGSRRFREMARLTKLGTAFRARPEPQLVKLVRDAFLDTYGDSPTPREWRRWMTEFRKFGVIASGRVARTDSEKKRTPAMRERYYEGPGFSFMDFHEKGRTRYAALSRLALAYFEAGDFSDAARARFDAEANIDHLVYPSDAEIPNLPPSRQEARPVPKPPRRLRPRLRRNADHQADQAA
jgi:hypothetical protein